MIWTAAEPIPATITGAASGSSTPPSTWRAVRPIPVAASVRSRSTSVMPVYVLTRIGGMPSAIIASSVGRTLNPNWGSMRTVIGTAMPISASDGIARAMLAALTAIRPPRRVWPT